jgi:hypothetical protein
LASSSGTDVPPTDAEDQSPESGDSRQEADDTRSGAEDVGSDVSADGGQGSPASVAAVGEGAGAVQRPAVFAAGELECREPPDDGSPLDAGQGCWCLRELVRTEILLNYGAGDGAPGRGFGEISRLCGSRAYGEGSEKAARDALQPEGRAIVREALKEASGANPELVRRGAVPDAGGGRAIAREAQQMLASFGYDPGRADGSFGARSADALKAFQEAVGIGADGKLDPASLGLLRNACLLPSTSRYRP